MDAISEAAAEAEGYRPLTAGYVLPHEQLLLDAVLRDMRRGCLDHVVVKPRMASKFGTVGFVEKGIGHEWAT